MEIKDKKGTENVVADHLSRFENFDHVSGKSSIINEQFPDENIFSIFSENLGPQNPEFSKSEIELYAIQSEISDPWYADLVNFHAGNKLPLDMT